MWNKIIGLVGPTGSGKSFEAAKLFSQSERAAVYQIVRRDTNYLGAATNIYDGEIKDFCLALSEPEFRYIYRISEEAKKVEGNKFILPDFESFIKCCFERENMTMIVDEAHFLCNPRYMPPYFWESIVTGRHMYLDIIYVTQRFTMVHHDMTANTHEFRFWHITEPADLRGIEDRCGQEIANRVANLRRAVDLRKNGGIFTPGEMLIWNAHEKGEIETNARQPNVSSLQKSSAVNGLRNTHGESCESSSNGIGVPISDDTTKSNRND